MENFTVKELARLAGVSVRALHHYDHIGLLRPGQRSDALYRLYGKKELVRLQQVLLYKELGFALSDIKEILDNSLFDVMEALQGHQLELQKRSKRLSQLLMTVENTIRQVKSKNEKMDYKELYKGFSKAQAEAYETEAKERWGNNTVEESNHRIMQLSKGQWDAVKDEAEAINTGLTSLMHLPVEDPKVQALIERHFNMTGTFYTVTPEIYLGLANMYVDDERFKAYYEKYAEGLASFISRGMKFRIEK